MIAQATPTRTTWRAVLADAVGSARFVMDLEGASGDWRHLLEQNGCVLLDPTRALAAPVHGAVVARHLLSRAREPDRVLAEWLGLLEAGGRVVLLESAARRGFLRRESLLFPPMRPSDPGAPYRRGLSPADASLLLQGAGFIDIRCFALPVPPSVSVHYLVSARRR